MKPLSTAQTRFLREVWKAGQAGVRTPMTGGCNSATVASGWYRTAYSLERRGLVHLDRSGDAYVARPSTALADMMVQEKK